VAPRDSPADRPESTPLVDAGTTRTSVDAICSGDPAGCVDPRINAIQQRTGSTPELPPSCIVADAAPRGTTAMTTAPEDTPAGGDRVIRMSIEVEDGLGVDPQCFGRAVMTILGDPRGWTASQDVSFQWVETDADLRLVLASPSLTDRLCAPLNTAGLYSCRNENHVVLNSERWRNGATAFHGDLVTYRSYLVNHEVGHFLGRGHLGCPGSDQPAPVMMQQTKGVGGCVPNGWPTAAEAGTG
jgi:hypothetical protein